jgi:hypothetical protein
MGLLSLFKKGGEEGPGVIPLPSGSFTIDAAGKVVVSTLPRAYPEAKLRQISELVLKGFASAREAQQPLTELVVQYGALRMTARELRGGAIIFLAPRPLEKR